MKTRKNVRLLVLIMLLGPNLSCDSSPGLPYVELFYLHYDVVNSTNSQKAAWRVKGANSRVLTVSPIGNSIPGWPLSKDVPDDSQGLQDFQQLSPTLPLLPGTYRVSLTATNSTGATKIEKVFTVIGKGEEGARSRCVIRSIAVTPELKTQFSDKIRFGIGQTATDEENVLSLPEGVKIMSAWWQPGPEWVNTACPPDQPALSCNNPSPGAQNCGSAVSKHIYNTIDVDMPTSGGLVTSSLCAKTKGDVPKDLAQLAAWDIRGEFGCDISECRDYVETLNYTLCLQIQSE